MTVWTLAALPAAPLALWGVGLATGQTPPPRWWRRRRWAHRTADRIARWLPQENGA